MRITTAALGIVVLAAVSAATADTFTVAVIPDTQNYTDYANRTNPAAQQRFLDETNYLANNKTALNLAFVTHVGDVVQHGDLQGSGDVTDGEWVRAQTAMKVLADANIPFGMSMGNHDYDNYSHTSGSRPLNGSAKWNQYLTPLVAGKPWYGGDYKTTATGAQDSYQIFTAAGKTFMNLSLDMCPTNDSITWAQSVINAHPGVPTMITTHDYENFTATTTRNNSQARNNDLSSYFSGSPTSNTPDQLWTKLITGNDQIFMVLCGHTWGGTDSTGVSTPENLRIDNNNFGHPVYQVLSDYQGNTFSYNTTTGVYTPNAYTGGEGWLRLMTFDTVANTIHFQTYSPTLDLYAGVGSGPNFKIDPSFSDFTLAIPAQVPEPATMGLLVIGGVLGLIRRNRK